jgi:D-alanyl-D-alanine carboxypeptidase/D-alanyl-D-alanine-endopeptidase (penicillin-binding protein 4)
MKILSLFIGTAFLISTIAKSQSSVQNALANFANSTDMTNATVSFLAINIKTGEKIAALNPNTALSPASTVKLFSTASAIELLGPNYRPSTRFYTDGTLDAQGNLDGNLWIRGGGDPSLGSEYFTSRGKENQFIFSWADTLISLGIKNILGSIISDASEFGYNGIPDGWSWSDMGNYYGAGPSGLVIYDNAVRYYFKTGYSIGSPVTLLYTYPKLLDFTFQNYINSAKRGGDNSFIYGSPYSNYRFGTGTLPMNSASFLVKGSLPDPELQFAQEVHDVLVQKGITTTKGIRTVRTMNPKELKQAYESGFKLIFTHLGESIKSIATTTNHKSVNIFAEQLVCLAGYVSNGSGTTHNGLTQLEKHWGNKIDMKGLYLTDGCGLSRSNAVSTSHFCALLKYMSTSTNFADFYSTLPVSGESGTLKGVCRNQAAHGRIHAKSGTMSRIKSYAGYIDSTSGKQIAFAIIVNNYSGSSSSLVNEMEKIFNLLSQY